MSCENCLARRRSRMKAEQQRKSEEEDAEAAIVHPFAFQPQLPPPSARTFRPPMGAMSCAMARVLQREGYSPLLGDVFSNDVFVGGGGRKAGDAGWRRDGGVACGVLCTAHQAGVGGHLSHAAGA